MALKYYRSSASVSRHAESWWIPDIPLWAWHTWLAGWLSQGVYHQFQRKSAIGWSSHIHVSPHTTYSTRLSFVMMTAVHAFTAFPLPIMGVYALGRHEWQASVYGYVTLLAATPYSKQQVTAVHIYPHFLHTTHTQHCKYKNLAIRQSWCTKQTFQPPWEKYI